MGKHSKKKDHSTTRAIAAVTVATGAAIAVPAAANAATMPQWDRTAQREAGGDWHINYSSDGLSVGGLQFQSPSWHAALDWLQSHGYDVSCWNHHLYQGMPRSAVPGKDETVLGGEALLHIQGSGAWANGNASGSVSMFDGGPNPWGLSGTHVPSGLLCSPGHTGGGGAPAPSPKPKGDGDGETADDHVAAKGHYVVKPGDYLYKIALHYYGNGDLWKRIWHANPSISDPNLIYIGQVLTIPE